MGGIAKILAGIVASKAIDSFTNKSKNSEEEESKSENEMGPKPLTDEERKYLLEVSDEICKIIKDKYGEPKVSPTSNVAPELNEEEDNKCPECRQLGYICPKCLMKKSEENPFGEGEAEIIIVNDKGDGPSEGDDIISEVINSVSRFR